MKRWIIAALVLGLLTGCVRQTQDAARKESLKRWYSARAEVLCGLAVENLKVGQLTSAAKAAKESLGLDAGCLKSRVVLAKVYIEQGQYENAVQELEIVKDAEPGSPEVHYLLGVAHEKLQQPEQALACYRQALAIDSGYVDAVLAIGEVMAEMEQPADALAYIEEHMPATANNPAIYELAGRLAMILCDYDRAERYSQAAHDLDYQNACYMEALARAQFSGGRYDRAAASLQQLSETAAYKKQAWVYVMLSECMLSLGRPADAYDAAFRATEIAPTGADAWSSLARASLATGDFFRASCAAREALRLNSSDTGAALVLGYSLLRNGQASEAVTALTEATTAHPQDATLKCLLGRAYAATGQRERARQCYVQAWEAEPDNVVAQELLGRSDPTK
jgi:tetratricopeptide (TPR) repeat protein